MFVEEFCRFLQSDSGIFPQRPIAIGSDPEATTSMQPK
jgi:hypothetical protein